MAAYTCAVIERVSSAETPIRCSHEVERNAAVELLRLRPAAGYRNLSKSGDATRRAAGELAVFRWSVPPSGRRGDGGGGVTAVNRWSRYIFINNRRCFPLQLGSTAARTSADFPSSCFTPCAYYTRVRRLCA